MRRGVAALALVLAACGGSDPTPTTTPPPVTGPPATEAPTVEPPATTSPPTTGDGAGSPNYRPE